LDKELLIAGIEIVSFLTPSNNLMKLTQHDIEADAAMPCLATKNVYSNYLLEITSATLENET